MYETRTCCIPVFKALNARALPLKLDSRTRPLRARARRQCSKQASSFEDPCGTTCCATAECTAACSYAPVNPGLPFIIISSRTRLHPLHPPCTLHKHSHTCRAGTHACRASCTPHTLNTPDALEPSCQLVPTLGKSGNTCSCMHAHWHSTATHSATLTHNRHTILHPTSC